MEKKGKVWLVGAGPGDAGLFTLKGRKVLEQADVVVYDSLVGDGVLTMIPSSAEKIDAGKRAGAHKVPQQETNQILLRKAQEGKKVVRLKGGDPFLFGRGGEELELLAENDIPFEVVPGVPSPIAVTAYNGIPVTHRDFVSSVHFITAHRKSAAAPGTGAEKADHADGGASTKNSLTTETDAQKTGQTPGRGSEEPIHYEELVKGGGTLVFMMGASRLHDICTGLLQAGMDPDMPAAILSRGTTARQKRILGTVSNIESKVKNGRVETPAIIVVGKVCALAESFGWYEKLPLFGYRVLVTRPEGLSSTLAEKLRVQGAEVLEIPAIATVPIENNLKLIHALMNLDKYQWIAFTSPSGVKVFWDQMQTSEVDVRALGHIKVAALGKGTARELKKRGIIADVIPPVFDGKALGKAIAAKAEPDSRILIPRAEIGNRELIEELRGFAVDDVPTYRTEYRKSEVIDESKLFNEGEIDCAVFTSSSTVKAFAATNPDIDFTKVCAACIGRQTADTARQYGMQVHTAKSATIDSLVDLVISLRKS